MVSRGLGGREDQVSIIMWDRRSERKKNKLRMKAIASRMPKVTRKQRKIEIKSGGAKGKGIGEVEAARGIIDDQARE